MEKRKRVGNTQSGNLLVVMKFCRGDSNPKMENKTMNFPFYHSSGCHSLWFIVEFTLLCIEIVLDLYLRTASTEFCGCSVAVFQDVIFVYGSRQAFRNFCGAWADTLRDNVSVL